METLGDIIKTIFTEEVKLKTNFFLTLGVKLIALMVLTVLLILLILQIRRVLKKGREVSELKTELKKASSTIEELDRLKTEFISIITHEIKTPIAEIAGYLSMVLEGVIGGKIDEEVKSLLRKAYLGVVRLSSLVSSLIKASKIKQEAIKTPMEISSLVQQVVNKFSLKAQKKNLTLEFSLPSKIPTPLVAISPTDFEVILSCLLDNAIKFTPSPVSTGSLQASSGQAKEGRITVEIAERKNDVIVSVSDTGPGIAEKDLPHMFEKFYQADTSYTREAGGVGLGLYIAKSVVQAYGGKIWVTSKEGAGSKFSFSLPLAE